MFDYAVVLPVLAALVHGAGFVLYNIQVVRKQSEPNPTSWSLWALLATLNAFSFREMNDLAAALQFFAGSVGCILTFLYVLAVGRFRWPTRREWAMFAVGIASIVVWARSGATAANMLLVGVVVWSFVPTFARLWENPLEEKPLAWWFWTCAFGITVVFVYFFRGGWTLSMAMPIAAFVLHGVVPVLSSGRRKQSWRAKMSARLQAIERQSEYLVGEIRRKERLLQQITKGAVDLGSNHEQLRRGARREELEHDRVLLDSLKRESTRIRTMVIVAER